VRDRRVPGAVISLAFHHVGIVTSSLDTAVDTYTRLGYSASQRFDDPLQKVAIVLMRKARDPLVELITPSVPGSPAAGWLKRVKAGPYHTGYAVPSIANAVDALRDLGFAQVTEPLPAVAFEMRPVAFFWSGVAGLLELVEGA
jgi:catechol 2,3-dioxygenase-like lactoylglutathione lyase family enzyme